MLESSDGSTINIEEEAKEAISILIPSGKSRQRYKTAYTKY